MSSDCKSVVHLLKPLMIFSGIWKLPVKNSKVYWWYSRILHGIFIIFLFLVTFKLLQLLWIDASYKAIYSNLGILLSVIAIWSKTLIFLLNDISQLFQIIMDEERTIWMSMNEEFILHYHSKIKYSRKWNWSIMVNVGSLGLSLVLTGLVTLFASQPSVAKSENEELQEWLMYPIWLPFKERDRLPVVVVLNIVFVVIGTGLFAVSHMIIATLMIYTVAQFEMLHIRIKQLDASAAVFHSLKEIALTQNELIKFCKHLNMSTKYVVFVEFLVNSFNVASVATQFASVQTDADFLFVMSYFAVLVMQVFALGWLANEIKIQSLKVADVFCELNWYNWNLHDRKLLCFMLMQSQKSLTISIGPFGMMTTQTALATMKAAYSYLMLMQNYSQ